MTLENKTNKKYGKFYQNHQKSTNVDFQKNLGDSSLKQCYKYFSFQSHVKRAKNSSFYDILKTKLF